MECDVCSKAEEPFLCATCARTTIYLTRLEVAKVLLEKDSLGQKIENIVNSNINLPRDEQNQGFASVWESETKQMKIRRTRDEIDEKKSHVQSLRHELGILQDEITKRKAEITVRRTDLESVKSRLPDRQGMTMGKMIEVKNKGTTSFDSLHKSSTNTKAFLCREAAALLRLKQKKRVKSGTVKDMYSIAGLFLPDLRDINNIRCVDMTAVLNSTAHLLVLVAFYLGVRLPAEITLPHRDYPLSTINTPPNSYLSTRIAFPGSGSTFAFPSSPTSSKHDQKPLPRPRPLFVGSDDRDEKIAQVAKKDPTAFNFFLEGISLLAWDVSWVCHSQGFTIGTGSWEDACNIGQNLWHLILAPQQSPALLRVLSNRDVRRRSSDSRNSSSPSSTTSNTTGKLGDYSHSSAHTFLGSASSKEHNRGLKLNKYTMIVDPLKRHLLNEMNNAEWELLQEQEWDDGGEHFDEAVFIKTRAMDGKEYDDARSIMTTTTRAHAPEIDGNNSESGRIKGKSGWTKVKNRDKT